MDVSADHTFGVLSQPDDCGAGDLLHGRAPRHFLRGQERARGLLHAVRHQLKTRHFQQFDDLRRAFQHYDKTGEGKISGEQVREACRDFGLPIDTELLEQLLDYCSGKDDGYISWQEFANFLNWRQPPAPKTAPANSTRTSLDTDFLTRQIDRRIDTWSTSNGMYNATLGRYPTQGYRTYGLPSIRFDKPIPKAKAVADHTNYGDEGSAGSILQPSLLAQHGVYEVDMMRQLTQQEVKSILERCEILLGDDLLDEIIKKAASAHPQGCITLEGVRLAMNRSSL